MSAQCWIVGHFPSERIIWNEGYYFSQCLRCCRDLVRANGPWRRVPRHYRVTWSSGYRRHALASDFGRLLPAFADASLLDDRGRASKSIGSFLLPDRDAIQEMDEPDISGRNALALRLLMALS